MKTIILSLCCLLLTATLPAVAGEPAAAPVRLAIIGLVHDHVRGFIPEAIKRSDIQLVGIVEPNQKLCEKYAALFKLDPKMFFPSLESLLAKSPVQAVATFTSTFDHRRVVEECAPHGIHVMMEKPLAVNMEHARSMEAAARRGGVHLLVNYETTWYAGNHAAYGLVCSKQAVGDIRKIVAHDGHSGPHEIKCAPEFLDWLTDPTLSGGGVIMDFGCYGADLMTWLMQGQRPTSVFAITQQIKPDTYPEVDDEATIVLTYPKAQGIIQASWNWPRSRKDIEIYGQSGYVLVPRKDALTVWKRSEPVETEAVPPPLVGAEADALSYLAAVVRSEIKPSGLSSLEVNLLVVEILDAARESARTGRRIDLPARAHTQESE